MINVGDDQALAQSHFDFYKPTVFFFHAFFESSTSDSATLQRKDYNVILLQAQRMEAGPWYLTAARNTRVVGEYTSTFAGLDPAGPLFTKWPRSLKLDAADAKFVDIIHTDAGIFGYPRSIGHVDFWPNKGQAPQPGCRLEEVKRRSPDAFLIEPLFCSHWRSYMFYAESVITPNSFLAVNCKNWPSFLKGECANNQQVNMGINLSPDARGNFYLQTRDISPFSLQSSVPQQQLQLRLHLPPITKQLVPPVPEQPQNTQPTAQQPKIQKQANVAVTIVENNNQQLQHELERQHAQQVDNNYQQLQSINNKIIQEDPVQQDLSYLPEHRQQDESFIELVPPAPPQMEQEQEQFGYKIGAAAQNYQNQQSRDDGRYHQEWQSQQGYYYYKK